MLVDANLLIYAVDIRAAHHQQAAAWLTGVLNGDERVELPWQSIGAFTRIMTNPRVTARPLGGEEAWDLVMGWLAADAVWIPPATERTAAVYRRLLGQTTITSNLVPDAQLAALAIEHGVTLCSADSDFARFPDLRWENPLRS